jgi:hypothetical protein
MEQQMTEQPRYTDAQIDAAIAEFRDGGPGLADEIVEHLSPAQFRRYEYALEREEFATACRIRNAWFTDPALRRLPAPFPMFHFPEPIPDDLSGLDDAPDGV